MGSLLVEQTVRGEGGEAGSRAGRCPAAEPHWPAPDAGPDAARGPGRITCPAYPSAAHRPGLRAAEGAPPRPVPSLGSLQAGGLAPPASGKGGREGGEGRREWAVAGFPWQ